MERETKELKTPNGHKVVYKAWLTGREKREIQNVFLQDMEVEVGKEASQKINAGLANKAQDKTIEMMIVSVDGEKEKVLDKVLDLRSEDFEAIINTLNSLETPKKK